MIWKRSSIRVFVQVRNDARLWTACASPGGQETRMRGPAGLVLYYFARSEIVGNVAVRLSRENSKQPP